MHLPKNRPERSAPHIGFTEDEVKGFCKIYNRDFDKVKKWYDGYLAYNEENGRAFVPNEEIRQELSIAVASSNWDDMLSFEQESERLVKATVRCDEKEVVAAIEKTHDCKIEQYEKE